MSTKPQSRLEPPDPLSQEALQAFDNLFGHHPGYRPVHAKGILLSGAFTPSSAAQTLTNAPHITRLSTRVAVRFSDFAGVPNVPDFDEEGASPRGCAVRFYLEDHVHTDIVAHSVDPFCRGRYVVSGFGNRQEAVAEFSVRRTAQSPGYGAGAVPHRGSGGR